MKKIFFSLVLLCCISGAYAALTDDLIFSLNFNENTTTPINFGNQTFSFTEQGDAKFVEGCILGNCFNTTKGFFDSNTYIPITSTDITAVVWVRPHKFVAEGGVMGDLQTNDSLGNEGMSVNVGHGAYATCIIQSLNYTQPAYFARNSPCNDPAFAPVTMSANQWYMLVYRFKDSGSLNYSIYSTGARLHTAQVGSKDISYRNEVYRIGSTNFAPKLNFSGDIDQPMLWRRLLSDAEIAQLWNSGAGLDPFSQGLYIRTYDYYTGSELYPFTVTFTNGTTKTNTTDNLLFFNITTGTYTFDVSSPGYVTNTTTVTFENSSYLNFYLFRDNRLNFTFRDEETNNLVTGVTYELISSTFYQNYSSASGYSGVSGLSAGNYTLNYVAPGYSSRTYLFEIPLTVGGGVNVTLYLLNNTVTNSVEFTIRDRSNSNVLENANVAMYTYVGGQLQLVAAKYSDVTGTVEFSFQTGKLYEFTITKEDYQTKSFTLNPISLAEYTVNLDHIQESQDDGQFAGVSVVKISPRYFYDNSSHNITYLFANPSGTFVSYGINVTWNGTSTQLTGSNGAGGFVTIPLTIVDADFGDKVFISVFYTKSNGDSFSYTYAYDILGINVDNYTIWSLLTGDYNLGIIEKVLIVSLVTLLVAGGAAYFAGTVPAAISGVLILGLFAISGFVINWIVIVPILLLSMVIAWRSSQ